MGGKGIFAFVGTFARLTYREVVTNSYIYDHGQQLYPYKDQNQLTR